MADDVSLELWMDRRRLAALERVLKESGTDTQAVMPPARVDWPWILSGDFTI